MAKVTVIDHPLIQHKLTIMRDKETSIAGFRRLLREIAHLMCYEVTRDLELEMIPIETPMALMDSPTIKGKKLVFASILRAGNGLLDGMLDLVPARRIDAKTSFLPLIVGESISAIGVSMGIISSSRSRVTS